MSFDPATLEVCALPLVHDLCARFHAYKGAGGQATYAFGVFERQVDLDDDSFGASAQRVLVAAFAWQPPPPGAARAVCPEAPHGVLALSRMVAVPSEERRLRHISKPLRYQMRRLIDRTRWPVLITYSDEGLGHTGHVYKCSGWQPTARATRPTAVDATGARASRYANGATGTRALAQGAPTTIQRWEHWACARGDAARWIEAHGWRREPVPGKTWRSGAPAFTWRRATKADESTKDNR